MAKKLIWCDILPESVWCLSFRPWADPAGMVYDVNTDIAVDIYLQSGTGRLTASEYNVTHTTAREQQNFLDDALQVRKRLMKIIEFSSAALGGNEQTTIQGNKDYGVVGGHVDTAGDRMTSYIGCEEMAGYFLQMLEDKAYFVAQGTAHVDVFSDGLGWFGSSHNGMLFMTAGGWYTGSYGSTNISYPGSRTLNYCSTAADGYTSISTGSRCACNILRR